MADLRYDPVTGIWVAIARKRRERPMEFVPLEQIHKQIICPFCRGNEEETPEPIVAFGKDGDRLGETDDPSSWSVRIIPNKFPSLCHAEGTATCGPYDCSPLDGIQELLIPTPRHVSSIGELSLEELSFSLKCCENRVGELRDLKSIEHVMCFFNCRSAAGASLEHIHFQIMGSPVISPFLIQRYERNRQNQELSGNSLIGGVMQWELEEGTRILKETDNFVMLCPFASRFAFQVWIVPKNQGLAFSNDDIDFNIELSELCLGYVSKLEELLENPAYNLLLNLAPNRVRDHEHWFIEIFPRLNRMAGFELGTDIWVNPVPPELAVKRLAF